MKTYQVYTRFHGESHNNVITGTLYLGDNYYNIIDNKGKYHYFPIQYTIITEQ